MEKRPSASVVTLLAPIATLIPERGLPGIPRTRPATSIVDDEGRTVTVPDAVSAAPALAVTVTEVEVSTLRGGVYAVAAPVPGSSVPGPVSVQVIGPELPVSMAVNAIGPAPATTVRAWGDTVRAAAGSPPPSGPPPPGGAAQAESSSGSTATTGRQRKMGVLSIVSGPAVALQRSFSREDPSGDTPLRPCPARRC